MSQSADVDIEVVVTVANERLSDLQQVVQELRGKGLKISQTMENLGIVSGKISAADLEQIRNVRGVTTVEREGSVQLPPPNSEIQ